MSELDYEEIWRQIDEGRKARREKRLERIRAALDNEDGFERIEAITDEEWDAAQQADDEVEAAELEANSGT
jgi:hypothetical protein